MITDVLYIFSFSMSLSTTPFNQFHIRHSGLVCVCVCVCVRVQLKPGIHFTGVPDDRLKEGWPLISALAYLSPLSYYSYLLT